MTTRAIIHLLAFFLYIQRSITEKDPCASPREDYEEFITGVPEDTPVNSTIGIVNINGQPSEVTLRELNITDYDYLELDPLTRQLTLTRPLDTDPVNAKTNLVYKIQCNTTNGKSTSVTFTVRVLLVDVNDNKPIFQRTHHSVTVPEDTAVGNTIYRDTIAIDNDQQNGGNDMIIYSILPGPYSDYFDIPIQISPDITLTKNLDYEKIDTIILKIQAEDNPASGGKGYSATATLTVHITDVDDQDPVFMSSNYSAVISADTRPGTVVQVTPPIFARDQDNMNSPIVYDFLSTDSQQWFEIDNVTAVVKVRNYLEARPVVIVLRATELNNPERSAIAILRITITGANVNRPVFSRMEYTATISEYEPVGATVLAVTATDKDFGTIRYAIPERQSIFSIDQSGNILLAEKVDYEIQKEYYFNVTATDGQNIAYALVHVIVTDVNDNRPILGTPSEITVSAMRQKGAIITKIEATDGDVNSVLQYRLLTYESLFSINENGEIQLTGSAEDFPNDEYKLLVLISDTGTPPLQTFATVTVRFPRIEPQTVMTAGDDMLAIIFGIIAAVLLLVIILLIVYIIRRHAYTKEQLSKAKLNKGMDPQGLTYKPGDLTYKSGDFTYRPGDPSPVPSGLDLNYNGEFEETSDIDHVEGLDGATSIQENPLSDDNINYGFTNHPHEGIAESGEIQLDTAVVPYNDDFNFSLAPHSYHNGSLRTFHTPEGSSSGDSSHSDSTGDSNKGLMKPSVRSSLTKGKKLSWERNGRVPTFNSDTQLETEKKSKKSKEKPEITVYF